MSEQDKDKMASLEVEKERAKSQFLLGFASIISQLAEENYTKLPTTLASLSRSMGFLSSRSGKKYGELTGADVNEIEANVKTIRRKAAGMSNDAIETYLKDFLKTRKGMQDIFG